MAAPVSLMQQNSPLLQEEDESLCLHGILYLDEKRWTLWINQHTITRNKIPKWLKVSSVGPKVVSGQWKIDDAWYNFTLEVNDRLHPPEDSNQ